MTYQKVHQDLKKLANPKKAKLLGRFFKTGKGQYGEGDIFLGIMVPQQRKVVKKFKELPLSEIQKLINSKFHEERLVGVLILVEQYQSLCHSEGAKATEESLKQTATKGSFASLRMTPETIYKFYLKNSRRINNWDLVDLSAPKIVGDYLFQTPFRGGHETLPTCPSGRREGSKNSKRKILYKLVKSKNLWERRIAVLATFWFIRYRDFADALKIAKILLDDKHDLIHKAVGWMLREIGKRDEKVLRQFLNQHAPKMPRTMLRYAIEKFSEKDRKHYLLMK
jgi:3-methyladenine DNA glycosylase AlkD